MAIDDWPIGGILHDSLQFTPGNNEILEETDTGPPRARKVSTAAPDRVRGDVLTKDSDESVRFLDFWENVGMSKPFNWVHPIRNKKETEAQFVAEPEFSPFGADGGFRISIEVVFLK